MAHFARIENGIVVEVQSVKNCAIGGCIGPTDPDYIAFPDQHADCGTLDYPDTEPLGHAFLSGIFGGTWKQTSYHGTFRTRYAGIGMIYDPVADEFR